MGQPQGLPLPSGYCRVGASLVDCIIASNHRVIFYPSLQRILTTRKHRKRPLPTVAAALLANNVRSSFTIDGTNMFQYSNRDTNCETGVTFKAPTRPT